MGVLQCRTEVSDGESIHQQGAKSVLWGRFSIFSHV